MNGSQSKHIFCADSDDDRDLWVECLHNYTNQTHITEDIINSSFADDGTMAIDNLTIEPSSSTESARTVTSNGSGSKEKPSMDFIYNYFQPTPAATNGGGRRSFSSSLANPKASSSATTSDSHNSIDNETEEANEPIKKSKNQHSRRSFWAKKMFTSGANHHNGDALAPPSPHTAAFGSAYDYRYKQSMLDYEETRGPCQVFGVSLERAVSLSRVCEHYDLPAIVHRCIEYMEARGALTEEGIYRLSGSATQVKALKKRFNACKFFFCNNPFIS
jgi:RalA-binding protein 1